MPELRKVLRHSDNTFVRMKDLVEGDVFSLFEDDYLSLGAFIATEPPVEKDGVWGISADFYKEEI